MLVPILRKKTNCQCSEMRALSSTSPKETTSAIGLAYRPHQVWHVDHHQANVDQDEEKPQKGDHVGGEP